MFDPSELKRVVELHGKSFELLRWVNQTLRDRTLKFSYVHKAMSMQAAAEEWIGRHLNDIPSQARPDRSDLSTFSFLFASYLTSSFELTPIPALRMESGGCYCSCCSYLEESNHLQPKKLNEKAPGDAFQLKKLYLRGLVDELKLPVEAVETVLGERETAEAVTLATYGHELMRRSEFSGQGQGVLYLWRSFAWTKTGPKKDFKLTAADILAAEKKIVGRLQAGSSADDTL